MSAAPYPTIDEARDLIRMTGGEIESITDMLADDLARVDNTCAERIRSLGAELAAAIRNAALDLQPAILH
ncbi:MAG TPA: hypothetical protein VFV70_08835 [Hyphomonadaceae bacterium]|nr:hypothetical protein [Hyphomonadaceae bacterium]